MNLEINQLVKRFGDKVVIDHLSFALEKGKAFGLLGRNGAGKTTTIRMILGLIRPDEGEILWKGAPMQNAGAFVGYLPEERGLYPKVKVIDQLVYLGKLKGMSTKAAKRSVEDWLMRFEIVEHRNKRVEELSKGNQQKVQLISAVLHDPELLIFDEPFSGLDPINAELFKDVIAELIAKRKTMIFSSHQMQHVEEFCENICILKRGQMVLHGNLEEIKRSYGRTNLQIHTSADLTEVLVQAGIQVQSHKLRRYELKIEREEQAQQLLAQLVGLGVPIEKFELIEPSLHEIFIEKAGDHA